jgi:hypothetical protein
VSDQDNYIRQVFSQGSILFVGLVFQLGISFFAKLIVARELTLSDFGGVALGMTTASVVGTVACSIYKRVSVGTCPDTTPTPTAAVYSCLDSASQLLLGCSPVVSFLCSFPC